MCDRRTGCGPCRELRGTTETTISDKCRYLREGLHREINSPGLPVGAVSSRRPPLAPLEGLASPTGDPGSTRRSPTHRDTPTVTVLPINFHRVPLRFETSLAGSSNPRKTLHLLRFINLGVTIRWPTSPPGFRLRAAMGYRLSIHP